MKVSRHGLIGLFGIVPLLTPPLDAVAANVTACTTINLCYCINENNRKAIDDNYTLIRRHIAEQKALGKAIGYLSIPLSTAGGSYFGVNRDVAQAAKDRIEMRFGANAVWILNPGAEGHLPDGASGADYMFMWTRVLEGPGGLGEDFDFFYFTGPSLFAEFFKLTGNADMEAIERYFDDRTKTDTKLQEAVNQGKVNKTTFRNYYGLRASVSFSYGSHDEWNIARLLNERRRGANNLGIANQLPIFFDGRPVAPNSFEGPIASGDVGRCVD